MNMLLSQRERQEDGDGVNSTGTGTQNADFVDGPVPERDKLQHFRVLMGINNAPAFNTLTVLQRPAPNIGIYARSVVAEKRAGFQFRVFSILINGCLGLQIIVAAALTALGASNGSHKAVTVFGAVNTCIAGFLTFLKGSGLPNRLKYYHNEWSKVREYIEQREREFGLEGCKLDVEMEVRAVELMYEDVRGDVEANAPDNYVSTNQTKTSRGVVPQPVVELFAKKLEHVEKKLEHGEKILHSPPKSEEAEEVPVLGRVVAEHHRHRDWKGNLSPV
jgi:hypothetical protein